MARSFAAEDFHLLPIHQLAVVPTKVVAGEGLRLLLCVCVTNAPVAGEEPLVAHPNARLTPATRLELVLEVEAGWSQAEVARRFRVSRATVAKWWRRYREEGAAGLRDRSSAPRSNPRRTAAALEQRICAVRRSQGFGPHRIAWALGIARSTAYAVLRRCGLNRLDRLHRVSRRTLRYEHPAPGDLLHIDVKKLGRIPEGGGHRVRGRSARTPRTRGLDYLHVAVDDHSRYAYVAVLPDERGAQLRRLPRAGARRVRPPWRARARRAHRTTRRPTPSPATSAAWPPPLAWHCGTPGPTARRRTARPSASSRSCRTSGPTPAPTAPTPSGCTSSRAGSTATMLAGHTAVSAGLSPPHACKQRSWEEQLAGRSGMRAGLLLKGDTRPLNAASMGQIAARKSLDEVGDRPCSRISQRRAASTAGMERALQREATRPELIVAATGGTARVGRWVGGAGPPTARVRGSQLLLTTSGVATGRPSVNRSRKA